MKIMNKLTLFTASMAVASVVFQSCQSEAPFSTQEEGEVNLNVVVNSKVTRAYDEADLRNNARIYISDQKGVLHKWVGVDNIDSKVYLRYGSYKAEAMAGTQSAASFEDKYFAGETDFTVGEGSVSTQVTVTCKIANVVASVDETTVDSRMIKNLKVSIGHSKGSLDYTGETIMNLGYYTMPEGESSLNYTVSGTHGDNVPFSKSGVIYNVEPGHNYRLQFTYNPEETNNGGAFLTVTIADENLIEGEQIILGPPAFAWSDESMDLDSQIIGKPSEFDDVTLKIGAFKGFKSIILSASHPEIVKLLNERSEFDLLNSDDCNKLSNCGIIGEKGGDEDDVYRFNITFTKGFLNELPDSKNPEDYVISVVAKDLQDVSKTGTQLVRIANTPEAIIYTAPLQVSTKEFEADLTAVRATSATIPVTISKTDIVDPTLLYREKDTEEWDKVAVELTRAAIQKCNVNINGLKPSTEYEYKVVSGKLVDAKYEYESGVSTFITESKFIIPNASMEDWSKYNSNILFPGTGSERTFWDSGNEGANKAGTELTTQDFNFFHNGNSSARLESKFASVFGIGKFAAGNLFTGLYAKTDGTDGVLSFGREYNGSHPTALTVWVKYIPSLITDRKTDNLEGKEYDLGQIYVALSTEPIEIRTKSSNRKLFDKNDPCVLAYGEYTFENNYDENGALKQLSIPITYYSSARKIEPKYLIIVCSASKYGDYFEGGRGSVMYVDDFELVYE